MKHLGIKLSLILATMFVAGSAMAGPGKAGGHHGKRAEHKARIMAQYDANKNGVLDEPERVKLAEARKALLLQKFDANKNGVIDPAERKALKEARAKRRMNRHGKMIFLRLDANKDGKLALAELPSSGKGAGMRARFAQLDTNRDGFVDRAELRAAKAKHVGKQKGKHKGKQR
jgi:Ca2+-binding EF-hand superfamily protein